MHDHSGDVVERHPTPVAARGPMDAAPGPPQWAVRTQQRPGGVLFSSPHLANLSATPHDVTSSR